jgi:two-component system, chemotaxis family, sensor kinase CheA
MSGPQPSNAECLDWLDQIVGDFLMLNPKDLPAMARFSSQLDKQADLWEASAAAGAFPAEADADLRQLSDRLKNVILDREPDPAGAMVEIGKQLENMRGLFADAPAGRNAADAASTAPDEDDSMSMLDDVIIAAYVEQQQAVLPEMEQLILTFEKEKDDNCLSDLRRKIHTLKGESGAVCALEIEQVCHRLEDYLDDPPAHVATDVMLNALDWIARAVDAFRRSAPPEGTEEILAQFNSADTAPPPAHEPEPPAPSPAKEEPMDPVAMESVVIADVDLAHDFVTEAQEHFDIADENLLILEKTPDNSDSVGAVFRSFHTIKGVSGFIGLTPIGDLAHAAETLLDEVRQGQRAFVGKAVELTFAALDFLKVMMRDLQTALQQGANMPVRPALADLIRQLHELLEQHETVAERPTAPAAPAAESAAPDAAEPVEEPVAQDVATMPGPRTGNTQSMKVDAARIDQLLDTIGELVIIESIVSGDPDIQSLNSLNLEKNLNLLRKITHSLRDMGMSMRLVPVDPVFKKMARLVRDLARKSGKQVNLVIKGGDTEIDKGMVEKLGDPLVHMIRNSMDHGIEPVEERVAAGKFPEGRIILHAHHMGGNIHIDIEDDGRGLNRDAILEKAIARGIVQSGQELSDQDIFSLIFHAGFSTAAQVTEISGRGVGMDVVRRNIESLRGNVLIRSTPGKGSQFTLVLPLTTAIIDGMLFRVGQETYIMPTLSILESFRPRASQVHPVSGHGEMVSFRENLLPLFRLSRLLGVQGARQKPEEALIMVVEEYGKQWGLMVDELLGQQQVVIKSLGEGLGQTSGVVGASILADGRPGLILDIADIIRLAKNGSAAGGVLP